MERNDNGQTSANEFSGSGSNEYSGSSSNELAASGSTEQQGSADGERNFDFAGTAGTSGQSQSIRDRAKSAIGTAGEKLADVGSGVREKAGHAKERIATALEAGAEKLRERTQSGGAATLAGATADGSTAVQTDGRVAQVSDRVAGGMDATAEWLREADIDGLKTGIERQVKEHPGRTLLIAVGLGYLIGRAFRSNNQ
jgi:hypothetical protein